MPRKEEMSKILPKYATVFMAIKIYIYLWWNLKLQSFKYTRYNLVLFQM
jgi:hypothetical protein